MTTNPWLATADARRALQSVADDISRYFLDATLFPRLSDELEEFRKGGSHMYSIGASVKALSEQFGTLAFVHAHGASVPPEVFPAALKLLPIFLDVGLVNFQGLKHTPVWLSDIWTADIAQSLTFAIHFDSPLRSAAGRLRPFIIEKCIVPILDEWVRHPRRIHSLDAMGHNWWSVTVGGAGTAAALLDLPEIALEIAAALSEWARFPGSKFSRKRPNFGPEGDFVEGVGYGQYALLNLVPFSLSYPDFQLIPDILSPEQARGMADWLKRALLPCPDGYRLQLFSDNHHVTGPRPEIWHTIADAVNDTDLLAIAHAARPTPRYPTEFLTWKPLPNPIPAPKPINDLRVFPTSGLAFPWNDRLRLSVRAGEYWNHNHLDAGTFILHQDDTIWIDDSGTCIYNKPEYVNYYVQPQAHNVAYAPSLIPPLRSHHEGLAYTGEFLSAEHVGPVKILCADTNVISCNALARSYRWFFTLGEDAVVIWDDLLAWRPTEFTTHLHTPCTFEATDLNPIVLQSHGKTCPVYLFSDAPLVRSITPAKLAGHEPHHSAGQTITHTTQPIERIKFATAMGKRLTRAEFTILPDESGWLLTATTPASTWQVWFNLKADGRMMHTSPIARWHNLETDAYALILQQSPEGSTMTAIEASFVRTDQKVLHGSLSRRPAVSFPI